MSLLVKVGAVLMTVTCREELSGKWGVINHSLTGVRRSGSCLQNEVLMASPTPCILSSSFAFPLQKNVYPHFGSAAEPSLASLVSVRAAMSVWYLSSSLAMRAVLLSGLKDCVHVPCAKNHLIFFILTAFKGKTTSHGRLASFGFRMSFL